jgi:hypothetical protein
MDKKSINLPGITIHGDFTVFGPMIDIHDNGQVNIYQSGRPKPAKRKAAESPAKKASCAKPMTLKYYKHGNNALLMKQRRRVDLVFRKWNEWGWIDERTSANDFDAFFEGEDRYCNITWTGNAIVLTILLQELLKQPYIERQTGCSAKSLVEQQFGRKAYAGRQRLDQETLDRIAVVLYILGPNNPIPEREEKDGNERYDTSDVTLKLLGERLRSTKGV